MATVTKPIALNESFNTTEQTSRNIADVLAEGIGDLIHAVSQIAPQTVYDLDDLGDVDITSPSNGQVLKYNGTSQKWENGAGGAGGGHTIEDRDGVDLTQRVTLQFVDGLKATDDAVNDATVVSDAPDEYTWAQWNNLTTAQQEAIPHALITDAPDVDAGVNADLLTKLWENPSPTSAFAAQNITLSSDSDYDYLLIMVRFATDSSYVFSVLSPSQSDSIITTSIASSSGSTNRQRTIVYSGSHSYAYRECRVSVGASASTQDNSNLIPITIYGIKKTLNLQFTAIASDVSTSADKCMLSDGVTSVETELNKKVEGWTLAGNVTSTSLVTITIPATAKEILAVLANPNDVILISQVIPKALMSSGASLKDVTNTSKELYSNGSKWKVTDSTYTGKIYYR